MSPETLADVQAILEQLQARGIGRGGVLGYAFDPNEPDPDEYESDEEEPDEADNEPIPHQRRRGPLIPYGATPLQAGLMTLAEGAFEFLTRPAPVPPAPIVHVAPPAVQVNIPPPVESPLAYQRDADLRDTLAALAEAITKLAEAQGREQPAPVVNVAAPPAPVVNVAAPKIEITPTIKVEMPEAKRRKVKILSDEKGEIAGTVEE